mgnify:CR=1 FL=1
MGALCPGPPYPGVQCPKVPGTGSCSPGEASPAFLGQEALIEPLRAWGRSPLPRDPFPRALRKKVPGIGYRSPGETSLAFLGQEALIGPLRAHVGVPCSGPLFLGLCISKRLGGGPVALEGLPGPRSSDRATEGPGSESPAPGPFPWGTASQSAQDGVSRPGEASPAFLGQEALIRPLRARVGVPCPGPPSPGHRIRKCLG